MVSWYCRRRRLHYYINPKNRKIRAGKTPSYIPLIIVGSTSHEMLEKVARIGHELTGSYANISHRHIKKYKDQYDWQVVSRMATSLAEKLFPHLTAKREQAKILTDFYLGPRKYGWNSYPGDDEMERRRVLAEKIRELNNSRYPVKYT